MSVPIDYAVVTHIQGIISYITESLQEPVTIAKITELAEVDVNTILPNDTILTLLHEKTRKVGNETVHMDYSLLGMIIAERIRTGIIDNCTLDNNKNTFTYYWEEALACHNVYIIEELLAQKYVPVNITNDLRNICKHRNVADIVQLLIDHGANVNTSEYHNAYHGVSLNGVIDIAVARVLLCKGANPNVSYMGFGMERIRSPLEEAVRTNNTNIVRVLLEAGANIISAHPFSYTLLCYGPNAEITQMLVDAGINVTLHDLFDRNTALHTVSNAESVGILVRAGADSNDTNVRGNTPLHCAKTAEIANALLDAGADINRSNPAKQTPLHYAISTSMPNVSIVQTLIRRGAHINTYDEHGRTPLHSALNRAHTAIARMLLDAGADVHAQDEFGRTPIYYARLDATKMVLDAGATLYTTDKDGLTPLMYEQACRTNCAKIRVLQHAMRTKHRK